MQKNKEITMGFKVAVNHENQTVSVETLAPYSYNELSVLFCALGEVLEAMEKQHKRGNK